MGFLTARCLSSRLAFRSASLYSGQTNSSVEFANSPNEPTSLLLRPLLFDSSKQFLVETDLFVANFMRTLRQFGGRCKDVTLAKSILLTISITNSWWYVRYLVQTLYFGPVLSQFCNFIHSSIVDWELSILQVTISYCHFTEQREFIMFRNDVRPRNHA